MSGLGMGRKRGSTPPPKLALAIGSRRIMISHFSQWSRRGDVRAELVTMLGLMPWRNTSYKRRKAWVRSVPFSHVLVKAE